MVIEEILWAMVAYLLMQAGLHVARRVKLRKVGRLMAISIEERVKEFVPHAYYERKTRVSSKVGIGSRRLAGIKLPEQEVVLKVMCENQDLEQVDRMVHTYMDAYKRKHPDETFSVNINFVRIDQPTEPKGAVL